MRLRTAAFLCLGVQLAASCSPSNVVHRELHVCLGGRTEQSLFSYVSKVTEDLGYHPSTGVATDKAGNATTVLKASGWTTSVWLTNAVTFPDLNAPGANSEVVPSHRQFVLSVDAQAPLFRNRVDTTFGQVRAKLSHAGYQLFDDGRHCSK